MRRIIKLAIPLTCLALLIHDAASGRWRTFRSFRDERYTRQLFSAARRGDFAEMRRLMRIVGNIDTREVGGKTGLHRARSVAVAQLLLDSGADVNARDRSFGMTPLHFAINAGRQDIVRLLIANGADVNARDLTGSTPLHWVARTYQVQVAELLIRNGANVNARTAFRLPSRVQLWFTRFAPRATPLVHARSAEMRALLRKHGGKMPDELDREAKSQGSKGKTQDARQEKKADADSH